MVTDQNEQNHDKKGTKFLIHENKRNSNAHESIRARDIRKCNEYTQSSIIRTQQASLFLHGTCCTLASEKKIYFAKTYNEHAQNNQSKSRYEFLDKTEQFARKLC